jgi:uncharacterized protein (TIGR02466 family)
MSTFESEQRLVQHLYFPSAAYVSERRDFLESVKPVFDEYIEKAALIDSNNPTGAAVMSANLSEDARIARFTQFIANAAWRILEGQGYDMDGKGTFFAGMWGQQHSRNSFMPEHVHPGAQLVGFYFLETPLNASKIQIHDPRPAKVIIDMPERHRSQNSLASSMASFAPEPGMLFLTNSWLPHSFTRHDSDEPLSFIHFNLGVMKATLNVVPPSSGAEVV